jgi:TPR repeat protein
MKKIFLLTILFFQLTFVFGQNNDCSESSICNGASGIKRCWGNPQTFPEFPGIVVRVKGPVEHCFNAINDEPNKHSYQWWIEIKGSTNSLFRIDVTDGFGKTTNFGGNQDGVCVYPFEITQKDIQGANNSRLANKGEVADFKTFSNAETINVRLIKCTSNFKGSSNSNNQTTQQNDLTEYNRSKADLERQMAEKNAEGQQKSQNYTTAMNAGILAHNSGNYAEAKNQFSIALNNCNTLEARQKAQEYYNKSIDGEKKNQYNNNLNEASANLQNKDYNGAIQSFGNAMNSATNKAEKRNATIGVASSGVAGVFDILAKAKEEKRIEQENERIKQEQKEYKLKQENDIMEANWINAQNLANLEDYTQAIKLMLPYANQNKLNGMALNSIGFWYEKLSDYPNALKWYKKGAGLKDATAMCNIGVLYVNGSGVERNLNTALQWFNDACENGYSKGCENHLKFTKIADEEAKQKKIKIENTDKVIGNVKPFFKNGMFGFKNTSTNDIKIPEKYSEVGIFSNGLALAKLDDKFGYIDKLGNIAIPFKYTEAFDFNNGVAIVATNIRENNGYKHKVDYEMIDITGKAIVKYFLMYNFKDGLARARTDDKKWGFIDESGQIAIPFKFEEVDDFKEGFAKVRVWNGKDFKYGYIDKTGNIVIPAKFDFMSRDFSDGMAKVEIDDKYGFIDKSGNIIIPIKYINTYPEGFTEGLAAVEKGKKYGFIDKNGTEVIPLKYQGAGEFSEGLAYVKLNNKYGFIDKNGTEVIPLIYEVCWSFKDGLASVLLDGKWGCIDNTGKVIIPIKYNSPSHLQFKNGFATIELNGKFGRLDKNGNEYW